MRSARRNLSRLIAGLVLCVAWACQKSHEHAGSESHFLTLCSSAAACGELSCHAGICTTGCTSDAACGAVARSSECAPAPASADDATPARVCDVLCERDATCFDLGADFACVDGRCRIAEPTLPSEDSGIGADAAPSGQADAGIVDPGVVVPGALDAGPAPVPTPGTEYGAGCGLESAFLGDEKCLRPPSADRGLQIHVGPSRYDDDTELAAWVIEPGEEVLDDCWSFHLPNDTEVAYAEWEFSARPGLHHAMNALYRVEVADGQFEICLDTGADGSAGADLPTATNGWIARVAPAPENASIGWPLDAHAPAQSRLHNFNFTDLPLLREFWLNLYFPESTPSEYARPLRAAVGADWVIEPATDRVWQFECPIDGSGRLLSLRSRILPSTRRLTAWLHRASGERLQILEVLDANEPVSYRYDSVTQNPPMAEPPSGAYSGMLAIETGDALEWECHVVNDSPATMTAVHDCDLAGATVGTDIDCVPLPLP